MSDFCTTFAQKALCKSYSAEYMLLKLHGNTTRTFAQRLLHKIYLFEIKGENIVKRLLHTFAPGGLCKSYLIEIIEKIWNGTFAHGDFCTNWTNFLKSLKNTFAQNLPLKGGG